MYWFTLEVGTALLVLVYISSHYSSACTGLH